MSPARPSPIQDARGRPLRDLRISVTDRCNFRCTYCMPREVFGPDHVFLPKEEVLTYEEIVRFARAAVDLGVRKIRLTGGEPLLRHDIESLVRMVRAIDGVEDLALTTNASSLAARAPALAEAGLDRVTVSLDALDDEVFRRMSDVAFPVARVLAGIEAAHAGGLGPVKVNMVVQRGVNDDQIVPMARRFRGTGVTLRFIEYMDVGATNGWRMEQVVPAAEIRERIAAVWPVEALPPRHPGEVATRFRYTDGAGEVGFIASVTAPFCGACNRARLSADGRLYTCLFATQGTDVRAWLRDGQDDAALRERLAARWGVRDDRYSEIRGSQTGGGGTPGDDGDARVEMSFIGG